MKTSVFVENGEEAIRMSSRSLLPLSRLRSPWKSSNSGASDSRAISDVGLVGCDTRKDAGSGADLSRYVSPHACAR